MKNDLIEAIDCALAGQWDSAHGMVQELESDAMASWIHAVLHKIEGDEANSLYWYRRAGKTEYAKHEPRSELELIRSKLG